MLRPVLEDPTVAKVGQNLKYDLVVLRGAGVRVQGVAFDTMIASYLLDAGERTHGLNELSKRYLGHEPVKIEELIGKGKNEKRMDEVPVAQVANYAAEDADIPLRLQPLLSERLDEGGLAELNETVEVPLVAVLAEMEFDGIRVDTDRLAELSGRFGERVEALATEIEQLAGHPLNIGSPKQLAEVLFNELGLPVVRRTKTGPSTDASVLEELAPLHPLPAKIIEYRQFTKLKNTYVDALPAMVHPETGRVHTSFNQVVAATGRLSSDKPNLQNIPIRTDEGRLIRSAFTADPPGWKLLAADYSQIELRILAHYSGDEALRDAFASDQDIHAYVASEVYDVPQGDVTPAQRRSAKAVNFGIIYGQTAFGLAKSLGITKGEAADFIDAYFARYPGVDRFFTETLDRCREKGCVTTILGRRRAITGARSAGKLAVSEGRYSARQLNFSERTAVNTVIQGSAADLIKLAMLAVARQLTDEGLQAKMLLQIHDELVFECPEDELPQLADLVRDAMTNVLTLDIPLKVDVKTGENWAACE
jgi:DNA polymerase-1